jgi:hypothetical protein
MSNQFEVNVLYSYGKYYLYILTIMDGEVYIDIKEYSQGETE